MSPRPESIGPYRIEGELGRGGTGTVYLAEDTRLARRVALKVYPQGARNDAWLRTKIEREADLAARVQAPGICAIHETGVGDGYAYIAMRYVEGESLAQRMKRLVREPTRRNTHEVLALMETLARTIHLAHEAGVVHHDLKPENVMISASGKPVILDFGSARKNDEGDCPHFGGTPAYAAPEQLQPGTGRPDRRADVFALGVILYEWLTGVRPFHGSNRQSLLRAVLTCAPPSLRSLDKTLPRDLEAVLQCALEREPDARYQTALALAEDLRRVREHESITVRHAGLWKRYALWTSRRPAVAVGVTAVVVSLALGSALYGWFYRQDRAALAAVRRLSDQHAVPLLVRRAAEESWPARSHGIAAMDAWLAEAEAVLARRVGDDDGEDADLEELEALAATIAEVRRRREDARTLAARTIDAHFPEWARVIEAIADVQANPDYGGLLLVPQEGLVPLGQDPASGLFEFGHPQSGEVPVRDPVTGQLQLDIDSGFVFVLLPGGRFRMGAVPLGPDTPPGSPNVDPHADENEGPVHEVLLSPFFLAKFEASVALWERLGGVVVPPWKHPSTSQDRWDEVTAEHRALPGGSSWSDVTGKLNRLGLTLPTEAQHEYACRGGTTTPWWTGPEIEEFVRVEQLDLHGVNPPVPVFLGNPNPFGLLHVGGAEQLLDFYGSYTLPVRAGDGLRLVPGGTQHISGGSFNRPLFCRSASRRLGELGSFRPARAVDPPREPGP